MISEDIFDEIWKSSEGQLFLVNLANQFHAKLVDHAFLTKLNKIITTSKKDIWSCLSDDCTDLEYQLVGHSKNISENQFLRIAPWHSILDNVIEFDTLSDDDIQRLKNDVVISDDGINAKNIDKREQELLQNFYDIAEDGILNTKWLRSKPTKPISFKPLGDRPVFSTSCSSAHFEFQCFDLNSSCGRNRADIARDVLGLIHYDNTWRGIPFIPLGAYYFTCDTDKQTVARPTIVEAGSHSRFKSTYGDFGGSVGSWGRAIDLSKLSEHPNHGGREVIIKDFIPDEIHFTFLGYLRIPRGDVNGVSANDNDFLKITMNGQSSNVIRTILTGV